jgi:hypothetical protein
MSPTTTLIYPLETGICVTKHNYDLATRNRDMCHQPKVTLIQLLETWIYVVKHNYDLDTRNRDMCLPNTTMI